MTGPTSVGRVFAVNGMLEHIGADAYVIPTDLDFRVEDKWHPLTVASPKPHKPKGWRKRHFGVAPRDGSLWFIDVDRPTAEMLEALGDLLDTIADRSMTASEGRHLPRVVLPIISADFGGKGARRGHVIDGLLHVATEAVGRGWIDVVLVARDRADFAALQHLRRQASAPQSARDDARRIADLVRNGDVALLLGAGVSIPAGLPSWEELLRLVATDEHVDLSYLPDVLDQAELLREQLGDRLGEAVASRIRSVARHSLAHAQLAALGCREAVTTNFDVLYELAARHADRPVAVLPWARPHNGERWLLKLHGDVDHPGDIVLARRDFARFGADSGPAGSMLESLMLTRHLLVVGASMTDANVLRLAHDVMRFREHHGASERIGTVLTLRPEAGQHRLWKGKLDWISAGDTGMSDAEAGRELEIFLDEVAMHAVTEGPYLLDKRYAALLDADERKLARRSRGLLAPALVMSVARQRAWGSLVDHLRQLGARDSE